jgi:hypothetical protein
MTSDLKERLDREASVVHARPDAREQVLRRAERRTKRRRVTAATLGIVVSVGLVAGLLATQFGPAAGPGGASPSGAAPPAWLVDAARKMADANADPTPTSAEWVLSDANTIAPAVGLTSGDPTAPRYLVVLTGHFTTNSTRPVGDAPPTGSILVGAFEPATHRLTDFGITDVPVHVAGLQPFSIYGSLQMRTYSDAAGWSVQVPADWHVVPFDVSSTGVHAAGAMISNVTLPEPVVEPRSMPQADGTQFPADGIALVISTAYGQTMDIVGPEPPLSVGLFVHGDAPAGRLHVRTLLFLWNGHGFFATITTGPDVSQADRATIAAIVGSLSF